MEYTETLICHILLAVASVLFIYDSVILFIRGKHNRPRLLLGITTLTWGSMYLLFLFGNIYNMIDYPVFCGKSLISSHLFICLMFLFPVEVLMPNWLNRKRILIMLTPITILSFIYFIGLQITGQHIEEFNTFSELFAAFGHFNVWYRCILFFFNLLFIYFLLKLLTRNTNRYIKWQRDNFSDLDDVDISWMTFYKQMMIVIFICYIMVAIWGSRISVIIHTAVMTISFSILFYKALFFENKYTEDASLNSTIANDQTTDALDEDIIIGQFKEIPTNDHSFESKIPAYIDIFKKWMNEEKPYLYKDFKLADITRVLPLNRSYLSRVINEGFKQNFSEVVRSYRVKTAKALLVKHVDVPIYKIAEMCGFASDSTFNKAFQAVMGCTPKQYRDRMTNKNNS